jgi:Membrane protein involved in the export of O-antigen and teichoic acid
MSGKSSYRQIFKATSLFGGVQVVNILIAIVRSKFVAVLLGTKGVGIMNLLQNPATMIGTLTELGINQSAVRDISEANGMEDKSRISHTYTIFNRWIWFTGILGAVVMIAMSPWLSQWIFGSAEYTLAFIFLSVTLLMGALCNGQIALLQGLQKMKQMASANVIGAIVGLFVSIPLYYWFGLKGIVPTMILTSGTGLLISWYYSHRIKIPRADISAKDTYYGGLNMVKLGFLMTLSSFISYGVSTLTNAFINRMGTTGDVGLYSTGWSITNKYVGMVFTAMVVDYFPRLSKVNHDNSQVREVVNQQAEIAILILSPILITLLSTAPIVIYILYTKEFLPAVGLIQWVIPGILFQALSWCLGFVPLAKGDGKIYFWKEFFSSLINLICNLTGFYLGGVTGLGIAFTVSNILIFILVRGICIRQYDLHFSPEFRKIFILHLALSVVAFLIANRFGYPIAYISGAGFLALTGWLSWKALDKQMDLKNMIIGKFRKKTGSEQ